MKQQRILPLLAVACLSLLGACGGGGDAGPGTLMPVAANPAPSNPPPSNPPPEESSLIPEAGPLGAVLHADAALLRVLRPGAVWDYRGVVQPQGVDGSDNITYASQASFTGPDAQGYVEHDTNLFNGGTAGTLPLRFEGGVHTSRMSLYFRESGVQVTETVAELRSPVRVNDLYGTVERRNVDTGIDLDGDRVNETASVAMYSRVMGRESVDLPNRRGVEAVRVDMTARARVTTSATRAALPVREAVLSNWYVPGVGIVKRRLEEPNPTAGLPNRVVTEVLENWDGLTEGLGQTPTQVPSGLQDPFDAVGFDSHAVVAGYPQDNRPSSAIVLAQLDTRGAVLARRLYTMDELFPGAGHLFQMRLLRVADELRLFAYLGPRAIGMVSLDATGQRILRPPVMLVTDPALAWNYDSISYRVASDGAGFWLAWLRGSQGTDGQGLTTTLVARFDANGQAQTAPYAVAGAVAGGTGNLTIAADGNRAGVSWNEGSAPSGRRRLALLDTTGPALASRVVDILPAACLRADVLGLRPGLALTCWSDAPVTAARIDANGQLVLVSDATAGATLAGQAFRAPWLASLRGAAFATGGMGELYLAAAQYGPYRPGESDTAFTAVMRTKSAGGALAGGEPVLLARLREWPGDLFAMVPFKNSLLLLGKGGPGQLHTTVVWLPK